MTENITITAEQIEKIKARIERKYNEGIKAEKAGRIKEAHLRIGEAAGLEYALHILGIED